MVEMGGEISWQSKEGIGNWQGSFRQVGQDCLDIHVCCNTGPNLKLVGLWKTAPGVWMGWDYQSRRVRLTKLDTLRHCSVCNAWHTVQAFDTGPTSSV